MTDPEELVRRLREEARVFVPASRAYFALNEAADTIEHLRADLAAAQKEIERRYEYDALARKEREKLRRELDEAQKENERLVAEVKEAYSSNAKFERHVTALESERWQKAARAELDFLGGPHHMQHHAVAVCAEHTEDIVGFVEGGCYVCALYESHQREEQMRRALERIAHVKWDYGTSRRSLLGEIIRTLVLEASRALDALGKDDK